MYKKKRTLLSTFVKNVLTHKLHDEMTVYNNIIMQLRTSALYRVFGVSDENTRDGSDAVMIYRQRQGKNRP